MDFLISGLRDLGWRWVVLAILGAIAVNFATSTLFNAVSDQAGTPGEIPPGWGKLTESSGTCLAGVPSGWSIVGQGAASFDQVGDADPENIPPSKMSLDRVRETGFDWDATKILLRAQRPGNTKVDRADRLVIETAGAPGIFAAVPVSGGGYCQLTIATTQTGGDSAAILAVYRRIASTLGLAR